MKKFSNIAVIAALMIMMLFTVSCGSGQDNDKASENEVSVILSIDYPDSSGSEDVEDLSVTAAEGSSVLDVLMDYAEENDIEILTDDSMGDPYVTSINGVSESETAGWVYEVNDEMVMEAAGQHTVNAGDEIDWSFESWTED